MNFKTAIPRIALGTIFLFSGLNGFFHFLPAQGFSEGGTAFVASLREAGFLWSFIKFTEVVAGVLLLFNVAGQLGVLLLAPICVGIFFFHTFLSPQGAGLGWAVIALELVMVYLWRDNFKRIFQAPEESLVDSLREEGANRGGAKRGKHGSYGYSG